MKAPTEHRRVRALVGFALFEVVILVALSIAGATSRMHDERVRALGRTLASELRLTDLALWGGASYCRHPSTADGFAAYSDHPAAIEHLPAGSLVPPHGAIAASRRSAEGGR